MRTRGSIKQISNNSWKITIELPKNELTGKRQQKFFTFHGTRKEAEKYKTQKLNELDKGILITCPKKKFGEYLDYWLDTVKHRLKESTVEEYEHYINKHIKPALGNIFLQDLKRTQLQSFYNKELESGRLDGKGGVSAKTLKNIHRIIHPALEMAYNSDMIYKNVSNGLELPKVEKYKANFLNENQLGNLATKFESSDIYIPVIIAIYTGMRRGEVLGLTWDDINFKEKTILINKQLQVIHGKEKIVQPKTESSIRKIFIPDILVTILKKYKMKQSENKIKLGKAYENNINAVCTYPTGKLFNPKRFSKKFKKFLIDNDLPIIRFHDLRHSHASLLFKEKVPDKLISERLGHSSCSTTKEIYTHLYEEDKEEVANVIENLLFKKANRVRG